MSSSLTRKRILRCMGITALVPSITTTVLFILFSISASIHHSRAQVLCITSAITGIFNCLLVLVFTILPPQPGYRNRLCGAISSLFTGCCSAITLGWMNIQKHNLPPNIVGRNSSSMVVAGIAVFIVAVIAQTTFWTTMILTSNAFERRVILPRTHTRKPSKPVMEIRSPSPIVPAKTSYQSTVETKHSSIISQILPSIKSPTKSMHRNSHVSEYISSISETVVTSSHKVAAHKSMEAEVNHFDAWETSDLSVQERVAASLAEVERETKAEQEAQGLGITGQRRCSNGSVDSGANRTVSTIYETDVQIKEVQRQGSPPLPENELTPRSFTFPAPIKATMTSPRQQVRRSSRESGELRSATALGGTGKWLGNPRTGESAEMAFVYHHPVRI